MPVGKSLLDSCIYDVATMSGSCPRIPQHVARRNQESGSQTTDPAVHDEYSTN